MLWVFTCLILWTTPFVHGQTTALEAGIIGGSVASRGSWPFQAYLALNDETGSSISSCGGTTLDALHILTAAHCIYSQSGPVKSSVTVNMRVYTIDPMDESAITQTVNVSTNVWVHNEYNSTGNLENDIAILLLNSPVNFKSQFCNPKPCISVSPVTLPKKNSNPKYDNQIATAIGWGDTSWDGKSSDDLKQVKLTVLSASACALLAPPGPTSTQICVAATATQGICSGDSGGPLLIGRTQIGISSYGLDKCQTKDVFTRVAPYIDNGWIPSKLAVTKPLFDYCTLSQQNTLCQYKPYMSNPAFQGYSPYIPSTTNRTLIVNLINSLRQKVAKGQATFGGKAQPSAANMMKLSWDNALALSAQTWAQQTTSSTNLASDSTTQRFPKSVGQLIYQPTGVSVPNWNDAITYWYKQGSNMQSAYLTSFPSDAATSASIGGYTQLVWAKTVSVGCGAVGFNTGGQQAQNIISYVCNFGPGGNIADQAVYIHGKSPGSLCPTGTKAINGLCQ